MSSHEQKLDLCIKLEKITNRTFALNWKIIKKCKMIMWSYERRKKKKKKVGYKVAS